MPQPLMSLPPALPLWCKPKKPLDHESPHNILHYTPWKKCPWGAPWKKCPWDTFASLPMALWI